MNDKSKYYSRNPEIEKFQKKYICDCERYIRKILKKREKNRIRNKSAGDAPPALKIF